MKPSHKFVRIFTQMTTRVNTKGSDSIMSFHAETKTDRFFGTLFFLIEGCDHHFFHSLGPVKSLHPHLTVRLFLLLYLHSHVCYQTSKKYFCSNFNDVFVTIICNSHKKKRKSAPKVFFGCLVATLSLKRCLIFRVVVATKHPKNTLGALFPLYMHCPHRRRQK